jgi:hypothetical protein
MLIHVRYPDDRYDYVKPNVLDILIEANKITEFERSTGWVKIGVDPIRTARRDPATRYPNERRMLQL